MPLNLRFSESTSKGLRLSGRSSNLIRLPDLSNLNCSTRSNDLNSSNFLSSRSIKFDISLAERISHYLMKIVHLDMRFINPPKIFSERVRGEIKRFCCALEAYKKSPNPAIPLNIIIKGVEDKNFASKLKKYRDYIFMKNSLMVPYDRWETSEFNIYRLDLVISDIGDIFNYNYCFFWEEDDNNDIEYSKIPLKKFKESTLNEFRNSIASILESVGKIENVPIEEALLSNSGSVCRSDKSHYVYQAKESENSLSRESLLAQRSIIRVSPDNIRDTGILSVPQSNSIKLIEMQLKHIAEKVYGSAYVENDEEFNQITDDFYNEFYYFLDRDIKKEGLTKPRILIEILEEEIKKRFPDLECIPYMSIYRDYRYIDLDGSIKSTNRGHGLGMANAITTIIQSAVFLMTVERLRTIYEVSAESYGCIIYNDDFTAGFSDEWIMEEYWEIEDEVFSELNLIRNVKKSRRGRKAFSFCERYYPIRFNEKISYKLNEMFIPFSMPNISIAKEVFNSLSRVAEIKQYSKELIIRELVGYFGYEFFPNEHKYPYRFGGWVTPVFDSVDLSMVYIDEENIFGDLYAAYRACSLNLFRNRTGGRLYKSPIYSICKTNQIYIPECFDKFVLSNYTINEVNSLFSLRNNDNYFNKRLSSYYKERSQTFKKFKIIHDFSISRKDLYIELCKDNPGKDFLPHENFVTRIPLKLSEEEEFPKVRIGTKILSMVKYFNNNKVSDSVIPYINHMKDSTFKVNSRVNDSEYCSNDIFRLESEIELTSDYRLKNIKIDKNIKLSCQYYEPHSVVEAFYFVYGHLWFPFIEFNIDREETKFKDNVILEEILRTEPYNSLFRNFVKVKGYRFSINFFSEFWETKEEIIESLEEVLKNSKNPPKEIIKKEQQEEEKLLPLYSSFDYVRWVNDGRPIDPKEVYVKDKDLFFQIDSCRLYWSNFSDYGSKSLMNSSSINYLKDRETIINNSGGKIVYFDDGSLNVIFDELDEISEDDEDQNSFDLFDEEDFGD